MDGRGCLAQSLIWIARLRGRTAPAAANGNRLFSSDAGRRARRTFAALDRVSLPKGAGLAVAAVVIIGSIVYGAIVGGHVAELVAAFEDLQVR